MKKLLSVLLVAAILIGLDFDICFAQNVNVTQTPAYINNQDISTYEFYRPTQYFDLTQRDYHFEGSADLSDLYTNYYFEGISKFTVSVVNYSDTTLTVKVLCLGNFFDSTVASTKVYSGCSVYSTFKDLDTSKRYCLLFEAPCNFKGYITIN